MATLIEDYGLIGDSRTVALVSRTGSIDWLCLPRFDSDACFAALLGTNEHGHWSIRPATHVRSFTQRYRPDTLILETEVLCASGRARVTDFMPPSDEKHDIIRIIEGLDGEVPMHSDFKVRFGYGKYRPLMKMDGNRATLLCGTDALALVSPVPLDVDRTHARLEANFVVRRGDRLAFVLEALPAHVTAPDVHVDPEAELYRTERYWRGWASRCTYQGRWRDAVVRSLITLKALTYGPTGSIVAAPTTSLPEELRGVRNWDYRYCWLRDSALTLDALLRGGYLEEALAWRDWLQRSTAGSPEELQIMYGIQGEHRLTEVELPWLPGYEESRPVRIGNGAYDQFQLDAYGTILNAIYDGRVHGLPPFPGAWESLADIMDVVEKRWRRPDEGIWEIRSEHKQHFTYSKVMAWVAADRSIRLVEEFGIDGDSRKVQQHLNRWKAMREEMRTEILDRAFSVRAGAFTSAYGTDDLDASVLLIPHMGFLPSTDPRMLSTVAAIERRLTWDGLVLRYSTETGVDGLPGHEATFLICSFWLADNYAMAGRLDDATALLDRLVSLSSAHGLLAEEYHPDHKRQLGNYPQAFSHIGLINTAYTIEEKRSGRDVSIAAAAVH
jgi:GH15 family glucan-1,4-alpha-glucosidase